MELVPRALIAKQNGTSSESADRFKQLNYFRGFLLIPTKLELVPKNNLTLQSHRADRSVSSASASDLDGPEQICENTQHLESGSP
ncbi:hypothetical protein J6590_075604 [Homalodisca vitripennis]|nr:hypothetical protein J6590_075604 [Homalodisca vitripennis]